MRGQKGAAVVMAMFVVVLCTLTISPLIWNLFASAKTVSVGSARAQTREVALSGMDWARVILREDGRVTTEDNLTEPWALPLAETRVNEGLLRKNENTSTAPKRDAVLTGGIEDATGRLNLRNLGADQAGRDGWIKALGRLCELLNINEAQRRQVVQTVELMYPKLKVASNPDGTAQTGEDNANPVVPARRWEELRGQYGIEPETWSQLRPYVVFLPEVTPVNANTASAEVLYAVLDGVSFGDAQNLVSQRQRVSFRTLNDVQAALNGKITPNSSVLSTKTSYFLVQGTTQVDAALVKTTALMQRKDGRVLILWRN